MSVYRWMDNLPFVSCLTVFQSVFITLSRTYIISSDSGKKGRVGLPGPVRFAFHGREAERLM